MASTNTVNTLTKGMPLACTAMSPACRAASARTSFMKASPEERSVGFLVQNLAAVNDQGRLDHVVVAVEFQALAVLVVLWLQEIQQVARVQGGSFGGDGGRQVADADDL